jgi:hypothetical protein
MKKLNLSFLSLGLLLAVSCTRYPDKPKITISEYTKQSIITKGVIEKIMAEQDYKKMHEIAIAVESSRAVSCISVGEECNLYGQVLNKIVESSQKSLPSAEDNVAIYKKINELDKAINDGHEKLASEWSEYIKSQNPKSEEK